MRRSAIAPTQWTRQRTASRSSSRRSSATWQCVRTSSAARFMDGLPRQFAVRHAVRPRRFLAQPPDLVFLVGLEIALEPFDLGVALEGEDVGGEAVEEEAVVADDHRAAGEILQRVLERAQGFDVEVIRGLVKQQDVAA